MKTGLSAAALCLLAGAAAADNLDSAINQTLQQVQQTQTSQQVQSGQAPLAQYQDGTISSQSGQGGQSGYAAPSPSDPFGTATVPGQSFDAAPPAASGAPLSAMRQLPPNTAAQGTEVNPGYVPPSGQATQQGQQPANPAYGSPQYYDPNTPFNPNQAATPGQGDAGVQKYEPPGVKDTGPAPTQFPGQIQTQKTVEQTADAPGGVVRWLDKVSGDTIDLTIPNGQSKTEGRLTITLKDCRYPVDDPSSDAYAYLSISDKAVDKPIFQGWMIASSPAINALDSARYDVWVLRCTNEPGSAGSSAASNSASSSKASANSN